MKRRQFIGTAGAVVASGILPHRAIGQQDGATSVYAGGNIITLDPLKPQVDAMAVRNGLIVATGTLNEVRQAAGGVAQEIDLGGRTVIPGLNDSHIHVTRGGLTYALELRWDGVATLARGLEMVAEQAARAPEGQWVRVMGGWSKAQFAENRMPTPADLTAAAPDTPVFVLYLYGRGFLNAAAVRALAITPDTQTPPGSRYEFTDDGGAIVHVEPFPWLLNAVIAEMPTLTAEEELLSTRHFYRELARFGITSAGDMGGGGHVFARDYAASLALAETGEMPIRIANFLPPYRIGEELEVFREFASQNAVNANRANGLPEGFVIEGAGEALTVAAYDFENFLTERPDLDAQPGWDTDLQQVTQFLLQQRWPIRLHSTYNESIVRIMDVFEAAHAAEVEAGRSGFRGIRWAFEHAETISNESITRVAALGGGISIQARMAYAGEDFIERYGEAAAQDAPPVADIIAAGIPLGMGTDATRVASYNPWPALAWLVTGRSVGGTELMHPRHRRSRLEALYLYTVGSAWFSGEEAMKGRLAPGQFADFAVLNADYLSVSDGDLSALESELTVVNGKAVHSAGTFAHLTETLPPVQPEWSPVAHYGGYQPRNLT